MTTLNPDKELKKARREVILGFYRFLLGREPSGEELSYYIASDDPLDLIYVNIKAANYREYVAEDGKNRLPITLAMFVKNAEDSVGMAIQSVESHVREILVVDTGSTDNTIKICEGMGARIYKVGFSDFGSIRTITGHLATQPWILGLDADEILNPNEIYLLKDMVNDLSVDVWGLPRRRWADLEMKKQVEIEAYPDYQYRLYRTKKSIKFVNRVHERIVGTDDIKKAEKGPHIEHFQDVYKTGSKLQDRNSLYRELYQKDVDEGIVHDCPAVAPIDDVK